MESDSTSSQHRPWGTASPKSQTWDIFDPLVHVGDLDMEKYGKSTKDFHSWIFLIVLTGLC